MNNFEAVKTAIEQLSTLMMVVPVLLGVVFALVYIVIIVTEKAAYNRLTEEEQYVYNLNQTMNHLTHNGVVSEGGARNIARNKLATYQRMTEGAL